MNTQNSYKSFIPLIILIVLLLVGTGIYYFTKKNPDVVAKKDNQGGKIAIMGEKDTVNEPVISSNDIYIGKIIEIRKPINEKIESLLPKTKYTTLFEKEQLISEAEEIKKMMAKGKETLEKLNLSQSLQAANKKQLESLKLLNEGIDAYIAMQKTNDSYEKQKQLELLNYKINESNRIIQDIDLSTSNSSSSDSGNVIDILQ